MRPRRLSFEELVDQNKQELRKDQKAMNNIEIQIEKKQEKKSNNDKQSFIN